MKLFYPSIVLLAFVLISASCEKRIENKLPVVNAGGDITIKAPAISVTLTATVSDADDKLVTHTWSKISGVGNPSIQNPESLSTLVSGLEVGEYMFQFAAVDGKGGTSADTVVVIVEAQESLSFSSQPSNNFTEVHLFGSEVIDQTDKTAPELLGGSGTFEGSPVNIRAILKFDLSTLPANAIVDSARLILYSNPTPLNGQNNVANSGANNALYIRRITEDWDANTVGWMNQPAASSTNQISVPHTNQPFEDVSVDVKTLINDMLQSNNYGFQIRLQEEVAYTFRIFCSSKYSNAELHPRLELNYHVE